VITLPSGTVTFVFTDIEGSTERWERNRTAMQSALAAHDELMRSAIAANGGVVFKTIGDAFCAVFARPEDAVAGSLAAMNAIAGRDWSEVNGLLVRMAVHTGTADERDGDYYGPSVNRVARLLGIAHGGQILISGITTDLVQGSMPANATLHDLGQHRLKDLTHSEQVYQLLAPGLRREFPPLRSLDVLANNLPRQITPLIGRDKEVDEITTLVRESPLVTLVGSGGVGKTRVSLQVAANLTDGSGDGVWFVEFAPIVEPDLVPFTIANAAGLTLPERQTPQSGLIDLLRTSEMLLVFDNCEHLVSGIASVAGAIVRNCPKIKLLASSREGFGIDGEIVYRMPSLSVPPEAEREITADEAQTYGAVELFVTKAKALVRQFALTDANAAEVSAIVRRLDGIPLAIELAASRLNVLSPDQLLDRLDDRLRILTGGDRTRMPRQQTLRALIDWSYDLLAEREREVFRSLGIFVGGWTLETAGSLLAGDGIEEWELLDLLSSLVAKSLVVAEIEEGTAARYRLLESTRQYARDRLKGAGDLKRVARRHAESFVAIAEQVVEKDIRAGNNRFRGIVAPEIDNYRAALTWALGDDGDAILGARLAAAAGVVLPSAAECVRFVEIALARLPPGEGDASLRASLDLAAAVVLGVLRRDRQSGEHARRAYDAFRASGDRYRAAIAAYSVARFLVLAGSRTETPAILGECIDEVRALGMKRYLVQALGIRGISANLQGRSAEGRADFHECLSIARAEDHFEGVVEMGGQLAEVEFASGNVSEALRLAEDAATFYRQRRLDWNLGVTLLNAVAYLIALDQLPRAVRSASESLPLILRGQSASATYVLLEHIALIAALRGDLERAGRLFGFSDTERSASELERETTEQIGYERLVARLATLESAERERLYAQGAALDRDGAVAIAREVLDAVQHQAAESPSEANIA
jgi:predicted ATPase/class 3 adenylate cyclase